MLNQLATRRCPDLTDQITSINQHAPPSGSFGNVYHGILHGKKVALKCLKPQVDRKDLPDLRKKATREMYTWSKADHPHVLKLLGVAQFQDRLAMVSPWVECGTVLIYLETYPETDRLALCTQIADGLAYLHSIPLAHGDIKPDNILMSQEGTALLVDFGAATLEECSVEFTGSQQNHGTQYYMAPERLNAQGPTPEADVYALAITIATILSGSVPRRTAGGVPKLLSLKRLVSNSSGEIMGPLLKCWDPDPKERPSAAETLQAMRSITSQGRQSQPQEPTAAFVKSPHHSRLNAT